MDASPVPSGLNLLILDSMDSMALPRLKGRPRRVTNVEAACCTGTRLQGATLYPGARAHASAEALCVIV